ncbi:MAG: RnfABCDGE type electron transport complex subunit G [Tissierellia bacterium]|nr:RnfABCDGE type electron transport complex subunit G [Tissierellia bacterium]
MNKTLVLGLKLLLITAVAALCLSLTNSLTSPVIEAKRQEELSEAFSKVYPDAETFDEIDRAQKDKLPEEVINCYKAMKGSDNIGYVFEISAPGGYGGNIDFTLGVDKDKNVTGFQALSHQESAGFGSKIEEEFFIDGVKGVSMKDEVKASENGNEDNEIVAISGATYSTNAVVGGINIARDALENLK